MLPAGFLQSSCLCDPPMFPTSPKVAEASIHDMQGKLRQSLDGDSDFLSFNENPRLVALQAGGPYRLLFC